MTITAVNNAGVAGERTSDNAISVTVTETIQNGNNAIIVVALDNAQTTDGDSTLVSSVTDSQGNAWLKAKEYTNGQDSAGAGATCSVWYTPNPTTTLTTGVDTITVNLASAVTAKAVSVVEVVTDTGALFVDFTTGLADDAADPGLMTFTPTTFAEHLYFRGIATEEEDTTALTPSAGGWAAINQGTSGTTGTAISNMMSRGEYLIASAGSGSANPTLYSADHASVGVVFNDYAPPVVVGRISSTGSTFSPTVKLSVTPDLISSTGVTFSPTVSVAVGGQTVTVGFLDQTGATFTPAVTQQVTPGLVSSTGATFSPSVTQQVAVGLVTSTGTTFSPVVAQSATPGLIDQTGVTFSPAMLQAQSVTPGLITQTGATFTPSIAFVVSPALISNPGATFSPVVAQTNLSPGLITSTGATFSPTVLRAQLSTPGLIDSTGSTFSPSIARSVAVGLIDSTGTALSPTISIPQDVSLGLIDSTGTPFQPTIFNAGLATPTGGLRGRQTFVAPVPLPQLLKLARIEARGMVFTPLVEEDPRFAMLRAEEEELLALDAF